MVGLERVERIKKNLSSIEDAIWDLEDEIEKIRRLCDRIYDNFESDVAAEWYSVRGLSDSEVEKIRELARKAEFALWEIEKIVKRAVEEIKPYEHAEIL